MSDTSQQLPRHHVHHSYIWLGSIQVAVTLLVVILISTFSSIMGALAQGDSFRSSDLPVVLLVAGMAFGGFVLITGLIALSQWLSYKNLYYELGNDEFNLYSGVFNKKRVHVPYQRVQSVDQRASLLQRIFGVCTVHIDTAGGSSNKAVQVPYVQKAQAEQLRAELFARKQYAAAVQAGMALGQAAAVATAAGVDLFSQAGVAGVASMPGVPGAVGGPAAAARQVPGAGAAHNVLDAPAEIWSDARGIFAGESINTGQVSYEYGLSNKELILAGLSGNAAFLVIVLGVVGGATKLVSDFLNATGAAEPVIGQAVAVGSRLFGGNLVAAGVALVMVIAIAGWVFSTIGACISYGGFRACRRDKRVEVERGLLQHQFQGVDIDRIQSVIVKQSFIRRLIGYCELSVGKIDAATEGSDNQQKSLSLGLVVHPFVKLDRVPDILAGLVPEFADVPQQSTPVAPVALRRALIRRGILQGDGFWLAVIVALMQISVNTFLPVTSDNATMLSYINTGAIVGYAACVVLFVVNLVGAVLWFRGSGFAYNRNFMQISNGGLSRETVSFPRKKIQFGEAKTNPFQRHANTVTVSARTAAGVGGTTVRLVDVREEDAQAWLDWVKPHGNVVQ